MASSNPFIGRDAATLQSRLTAALALEAHLLSTPMDNYSINGKSAQYKKLQDIAEAIGQMTAALALANNESATSTHVSFTGL